MKLPALLLLVTVLAAQAAAPEVEITNEPHHHLMFENQSVRIFNVQVDPNTETQTHWHRHDYISITLGAAEISNNVKDKPPVAVKFLDGDTRFTPAPFAHFVRDLGDHPFRNVTIELLQDESLRQSAAKPDAQNPDKHSENSDKNPDKNPGKNKDKDKENRGLEVLANGTKQILFVKDGIRATEFELQPGATLPRQEYSGPHLLVAVSDLDLKENVKGEGPALAHMNSGESKWFPANYSDRVTNAATKPAKYVTLEFPQNSQKEH